MKTNIKILIFSFIAILFLAIAIGGGSADGSECYLGVNTNASYCESLSDDENICNWDTNCFESIGCCAPDNYWDNMGGGQDGCWSKDGDYDSCSQDSSCTWRANEKDQNPWCPVKNIFDARKDNPNAVAPTDVGCCEQKGCWNYDGNVSACTNAFSGDMCFFMENDPWCPECCEPTSCDQIVNQEKCEDMYKVNAPCVWSEGACNFPGGGGFNNFESADSCMNNGGFWNANEETCDMPDGPMFNGGQQGCWIADGNEVLCTNITGCAWCVTGTGLFGVDNESDANICADATAEELAQYGGGLCEGHDDIWQNIQPEITNADIEGFIECSDIQLKKACQCGPVPGCTWNNSAQVTGNYCAEGSSTANCEPPAPFCEHPDALNNQTLCEQLKDTYFMPCKWQNGKCMFNGQAVFGEGEANFFDIQGETPCVASGGTWMSEYYIENGILKQDSWCEKQGMFNLATGSASGNKGNCNNDCWACEFQADGSTWSDLTAAREACEGSNLGYCNWATDTYAANGYGFCNYPDAFQYGSTGDCESSCEDCDFQQNPEIACEVSAANCKWINETGLATGGYCIGKQKKTCDTDCFSCYGPESCGQSDLDCAWDTNFALCKPSGFNGEVCFNGVDDDGDGAIDCGDSNCAFDNFCGGAFFGEGCFQYDTTQECNYAIAFVDPGTEEAQNCTWVQFDWEPGGHCDMPGSNCWQFDEDETECNEVTGCIYNTFSGEGGGMCDVNFTKVDNTACFAKNEENCDLESNCAWVEPPEDCPDCTGFCDYWLFDTCFSRTSSTCEQDNNCTWHEDEWSDQGGFCDPVCFNPDLTEEACNNQESGECAFRGGMCEPEFFMGIGGMFGDYMGGLEPGEFMKSGCPRYDGNNTGCNANNISCVWTRDDNANNALGGEEDGWCDDRARNNIFNAMTSEPIQIAEDGTEESVPYFVDLQNLNVKDMPNAFAFRMGLPKYNEIYGSNGTAACYGYLIDDGAIGKGTNKSKYFIYMDTNGISTEGCCANYNEDGEVQQECGFEFYTRYVAELSDNEITETKGVYRCVNNNWVKTNLLLTVNNLIQYSSGSYDGCYWGTPQMAIEKSSLEAFPEYDKTATWRFLGASANSTYNSSLLQDVVGPAYYTPGSFDFESIDCSNPSVKDPKCKNFQKFGFNVFEDCHGPADEDGDGLINCDDSDCENTPICGGALAFNTNANDKSAPIVMFSEVKKMHNKATIIFDTNEPANGSVAFYSTNTACVILNATVNDVGSPDITFDDYKPFHNVQIEEATIGWALNNGTAYYYKTTVCDPSGNCGTSACLNFTTKAQATYKEFVFSMDLPEGMTVDIPELDIEDFNFSADIGGTEYPIGIKTNSSVTQNMEITLKCSGDEELGVTFVGVDLSEPKSIDLTTAIICDEASDSVGMNSSSKAWNKVVYDLGMGGSGDHLNLTFPLEYDADNEIEWCDDDLTSCSNVDDYLTCGEGDENGTTECIVPISMGFSAYTASTPTAAANTPGGSGSSGKSSGVTPVDGDDTGEVVGATDQEPGDTGTGEGDQTSGIGSNTGQVIAGIIILVVVLVLLAGGMIFYFVRASGKPKLKRK